MTGRLRGGGMAHIRLTIILLILAMLSACAPYTTRDFLSKAGRPRDAERFFQELDREVADVGATNRRRARVSGFPYLAADRFLASMKNRLSTPESFAAWLDRLFLLSREARRQEIRNLPEQSVLKLSREFGLNDSPARGILIDFSEHQAEKMLETDRRLPGFEDAVKAAVEVPDDYSTLMRVFGIYPVAALPFAYFSDGFFDQLRAWQQTPPESLKRYGASVIYRVRTKAPGQDKVIRQLFLPENRDSLGIPVLSKSAAEMLAHRFAPVLIQDTAGDYDRIGRVEWSGSGAVHINDREPVAYFYLTNAFLKGRPIWQINYVFWYPGRLGEHTPWFERGRVDGITLRVSLDRSGAPFMIDLMNNCGCSHQFFPRKALVSGLKERSLMFDALVPAWMPEEFPEKPVTILVNTGWHQVQSITTRSFAGRTVSYRLLPYDELESLPRKGGKAHHSMFDADGIVYGSDRIEPYFFFSMGIPDVGAMRQRGHHPIAMIGRSQFDDPNLFDLNFNWH